MAEENQPIKLQDRKESKNNTANPIELGWNNLTITAKIPDPAV
jgi:hypothetical protein